MRRGLWLLVPAILASALGGGCATVAEVRVENPMALSATDPANVEKIVRRVLTDMRFDIVRPPSRPGRIETDWLTGDSWFEFWRDDTVGANQVGESSLHTMRRRVTVDVKPAAQGAEVAIKVEKQRHSDPDASPNSISAAFNIYTPEETDLLRRDELSKYEGTWIPKGRDDLLEQRLLLKIQNALGGPKPAKSLSE